MYIELKKKKINFERVAVSLILICISVFFSWALSNVGQYVMERVEHPALTALALIMMMFLTFVGLGVGGIMLVNSLETETERINVKGVRKSERKKQKK